MFTRRNFSGFDIAVPDFHKLWDEPNWEFESIRHISRRLSRGDILFDVGSEAGWQTVIYARFVGAENICMFEPTPKVWLNARLTFEANSLQPPMTTFCGFVTNYTSENAPSRIAKGWNEESKREGEMLHEMTFLRSEDYPAIPKIALKDFPIIPRAIAVDVEGHEYEVLEGAAPTLKEHNVLVFASLHPQFNSTSVPKIHGLMADLGYKGIQISVDHEEHWFFEREKP